eukprot:gene32300-16868_t
MPGNSRRKMEIQRMLAQLKPAIQGEKGRRMCVDTVLGDPEFMGEVLAFYRLIASWMLCTAYPPCKGMPLAVQLPLPDPPPPEFASLPEYLAEDMAEVILHVSRYLLPHLLTAVKMDEVMLFLTVFIGSPKYVTSSHLRSKLSEVLHMWTPQSDDAVNRRMRAGPLDSSVTYLLQGHPMVVAHLVPSLLQLYVDVEFTDRANQFYMKFNMRQYIGDLLRYLWEIPSHREVWRTYAIKEGSDSGEYVRFANMLISDAIYLLDEALKKIQEGGIRVKVWGRGRDKSRGRVYVRFANMLTSDAIYLLDEALKKIQEAETLMDDQSRWDALGAPERQETESQLNSTGDQLRSLLHLAQHTICTLNFTTMEVTAPFLLPAMVDRVASMLNYFLKYLTGSERRKLALKEPEKYNFKPRELLLNIIQVYLHLFAADRNGLLVTAVAADARSYSAKMFPESIKVLSSTGLLSPGEFAQLESLMISLENAKFKELEQEDLLKDVEIPNDFLDPIIMTLMGDPVLLPTGSKLIMDRPQITRHLLGDQRDPITREPLTPDQLIPQLKERIRVWVETTLAEKKAEKKAAEELKAVA